MAERRGRVVAAATDGACSGNPGPGGWAALLRYEDGTVEEFGGHDGATTNNRMELKAALELLKRLKDLPRHPDLTLRTDSKYLIDGLGSWMKGWKRKGWKTAAGKPVLNQDLWQALDQARLTDVPLTYVKGHSGDPDNDRVDQIAVAYSRGLQPNLRQPGDATEPAAASPETVKSQVKSQAKPDPAAEDEPSPASLVGLLSRLELADRLASGGYSLSLIELAQLVEQPLRHLESRSEPWRWRDWLVEPAGSDRWRLHRSEAGSEQT